LFPKKKIEPSFIFNLNFWLTRLIFEKVQLFVINLFHYKEKQKRSTALQIFLFPVFISIGVMGWFLYLLGDPEVRKAKPKNASTKLPP
jgi:hypothetical protein